MTKTPHMSMNFLMPNQSHKEISINESLLIMDVMLLGVALKIGINEEVSNPKDGDVYILGNDPVGNWFGRDKNIAYFYQGWRFISPKPGICFFILDENSSYRFIDNNWKKVG